MKNRHAGNRCWKCPWACTRTREPTHPRAPTIPLAIYVHAPTVHDPSPRAYSALPIIVASANHALVVHPPYACYLPTTRMLPAYHMHATCLPPARCPYLTDGLSCPLHALLPDCHIVCMQAMRWWPINHLADQHTSAIACDK